MYKKAKKKLYFSTKTKIPCLYLELQVINSS